MSSIATQDGVELYVKDWGTGRPVVLMHGWPLSADTWDASAIRLVGAGYRVIAYDRRGFGRSDQPFSGYEYNTLSDDLAAIIKAKSLTDVTLVGFSMGGGEVARYMSRHEGRNVSRAALISSVVPGLIKSNENPEGVPDEVFVKMVNEIKKDRAHFFKGFFHDFFGISALSKPTSEETAEWARSLALQASLKSTLECVSAFATTNFLPDLASFRVPTLVLHGTSDKIVPVEATARRIARKLSNARYREIDGAPHGLFATHEAELSQELLAFLQT